MPFSSTRQTWWQLAMPGIVDSCNLEKQNLLLFVTATDHHRLHHVLHRDHLPLLTCGHPVVAPPLNGRSHTVSSTLAMASFGKDPLPAMDADSPQQSIKQKNCLYTC
uniref:Uncharacterized protein n=1 Tax=Macrostomum lignano TaxID=282301 RepID=A0A1I8G6A3_9PLAT